MRTSRPLRVIATITAFAVLPTATAEAATFTLTTTADVVNAADGKLSLREAVQQANGTAGDDTIELAPNAAYTLTACAAGGLDHVQDSKLTIEGHGASITQTCDATVMFTSTGTSSDYTLHDVELIGGPNTTATRLDGGAVNTGEEGANDGAIALDDVDIHGFTTAGGALITAGHGNSTSPYRVDVKNSQLHDNGGTAIRGSFQSIHVVGSSITNNTGSGISPVDGFPVLVENSTVSNNGGTGIGTTGQGYPANALTVKSSTVNGNGRAGILCSFCGTLVVSGSTISGNGFTNPTNHQGGVYAVLGQKVPAEASTVTITASTISGNKATGTSGGGVTSRVDYVESPSLPPVTTITGTTISGNTAEKGAGVFVNAGTLAISDAKLTGNTASASGGGIYSAGPALQVSTTRISDNHATAGQGGGLLALGSSASVTTSTIDANTSSGLGAGAFLQVEGPAQLQNSTFTANASATGGGAVAISEGAVTFDHVTAAANTGPQGAHLWLGIGSGVIRRSALVTPAGGTACFVSGDSPFVVDRSFVADATCGTGAGTVISAADPKLSPLAANGGSTPTLLPASTSPLAGIIPAASCPIPKDQRGVTRPQGPSCDAGSVEVTEVAPLAPIIGTSGPDLLVGTAKGETILGRGGDDQIFGEAGDDRIEGGPGRDTLVGGPGRDVLLGGDGADVIYGETKDTVVGGPGIDRCYINGQRLPRDC